MDKVDNINNMEFSINPTRLIYLLELYKFSKNEFLSKLQGTNKNPVLNLEELNQVK